MECPYCGSDAGYMVLEKVHRYLLSNFNGEPIGATEDVCEFSGKRNICINCERILHKRMFK